MEFYLNSYDKWTKLYNCSRINAQQDNVPLWTRQKTIINGTIILLLFFIFEILYIPCLVAIWKNMVHPCYKFLFFIGITDVLMLPIHGLVSALYSLFGVSFCSNPTMNYCIASCGAALFAAESSANLFLALDRLAEMFSPKYKWFLFSGQRVWLWTIVSSIFGLYYFCEVKPAVFSPSYGNWFLNPYQEYNSITTIDIDEYIHPIIIYYDAILSFCFPVIYIIFVVGFVRKLRIKQSSIQQQPQPAANVYPQQSPAATPITLTNNFFFQKIPSHNAHARTSSNFTRIVFFQVAAINGINVATFVLYAIMQRLPINKSLIIVGFYFNYLMFGAPPIIYLLVNRTIRNECRRMMKKAMKKFN